MAITMTKGHIVVDITKCNGEKCKRKETCYRFTAPAGKYQYYFVETPLKKGGGCDEYWIVIKPM